MVGEKKRIKSIFEITSRLHDNITDIYERLCDEDEADKLIDKVITNLRHLKSNTIKDK